MDVAVVVVVAAAVAVVDVVVKSVKKALSTFDRQVEKIEAWKKWISKIEFDKETRFHDNPSFNFVRYSQLNVVNMTPLPLFSHGTFITADLDRIKAGRDSIHFAPK